jgi:ABC-type glycerol-3-phosphate transport system permease component
VPKEDSILKQGLFFFLLGVVAPICITIFRRLRQEDQIMSFRPPCPHSETLSQIKQNKKQGLFLDNFIMTWAFDALSVMRL